MNKIEIESICRALNANPNEILSIKTLKKGMTNRSFVFSCKRNKYIVRIPGKGTDLLINRKYEAEVYNTLIANGGGGICETVVYINSQNGYKISKYYENARTCDPQDYEDVKKCIDKLRLFHNLELKVNHDFNIFNQLNYYESLWKKKSSIYKDYKKTKLNVLKLKSYIDNHVSKKVLCHIDAVSDNFLFIKKDDIEEIRLIDWEYAGMQDPHVDIAMLCIYSLYNREQIDEVIDMYFNNKCDVAIRIKIYCYIAVCGLLWSNWCEYKQQLGVKLGDYALCQYRYAKDYYNIVCEELKVNKCIK